MRLHRLAASAVSHVRVVEGAALRAPEKSGKPSGRKGRGRKGTRPSRHDHQVTRPSKKPRKRVTVLTGSQLNGADQDLASWAGLEVPTGRQDEYVDLVGGVTPLRDFFDRIEHGDFEVTKAEEDMGPGLNDTYWAVSATDPETLRAEVRQRLVDELHLGASAAPTKSGRRPPAKKK